MVSIKIEVRLKATPSCFVDRKFVGEFPVSICKAKDFHDVPEFRNFLFLNFITLKMSCIKTVIYFSSV